MHRQPYQEILYLEEERAEYLKVCKGKSQKYTLYTQWRAHIYKLLERVPSEEYFSNFTHFLMLRIRGAKDVEAIELQVMLTFLSISIGLNCFTEGLGQVGATLLIGVPLAIIIKDVLSGYHKRRFYEDLFSIAREAWKTRR